MKILITGSNGLIGHELFSVLAENKNNQLFLITRNDIKDTSTKNNINIIDADLEDDNFISKLPKEIDIIFHFAQSNYFRDFPNNAISLYKVNTVSTLYLLNYAKSVGCKKFIYASTGGIYGFGENIFSEDHKVIYHNEIGFYQTSKLNSEVLVENYGNYFTTIILRFFFVYGKRQRNDMLIPRLIGKVIKNEKISLNGEEGIRINPIYVNDAVSAILNCLNLTGNYKINIAGNEALSIKEITTIIGSHLNKNPNYEIIHSDINKDLIANIDKMKNLLNYTPKSFTEQIKNML